jgi:RimJ/RimL family protein N-acetyltransferase
MNNNKTHIIKFARGILVPYNEGFDRQTVAWLNDKFIQANFGGPGSITINSHKNWLKQAKNIIMWGILDGYSKHCGNVLLHVDDQSHKAYFQIYIGLAESRGKGLGKSTTFGVLEYAFRNLNLEHLWLHTLIDNIVAENMYESIGFVFKELENMYSHREMTIKKQKRWEISKKNWLPGTNTISLVRDC